MSKKDLTEQEIHTRNIITAIWSAGWQPCQIREEVYITDGQIHPRGRIAPRGKRKRADYVLYHHHIPLAIIEAKDINHGQRPVPYPVPAGAGRLDARFSPNAWGGHSTNTPIHRYGDEEEAEPMKFKIYDVEGNLQGRDWLEEHYGLMTIQSPGDGPCYRVVELRERYADSAFIAQVRNSAGEPQQGVHVIFYWDSADSLPGVGWLEKGVAGLTNQNGDVGFGMGPGAYHTPPKQGPHKAWVSGQGASEMLEGIGMIAATNHNHINAVWQWAEDEPEPDPEPEVDLAEVLEELKAIRAAVEKIAARLA
jgi:hypothetical protein